MAERGPRAYVAEFIGTFFLVFFVCTIVVLNSKDGLGYTDWAVIGLVHAFVLAFLIYSLGGTSGAHFNPAVTAALAVVRKIDWVDAVIYWLVQLAGAVAGALVVKLLLLDEGKASHYGATAVSPLVSGKAMAGLLCEIIGTFVLVWAIMATAVNPRGDRSWAGWVIGISLGLGVMVLGPLSGAGFNPARWFGPALVGRHWADAWIYIVGPVFGGIAAALTYTFLAIEPQDREGLRPIDRLP